MLMPSLFLNQAVALTHLSHQGLSVFNAFFMGSHRNLPQAQVSCPLVALPGIQGSPDLSVLPTRPSTAQPLFT